MIEKPIPREENLGSPSKPIPKRDINCETNITEPLARSMIPRARMAMDRFDGHSSAAAITKGKTEQIADIRQVFSGTCKAYINGARAMKRAPANRLSPPILYVINLEG